MEYNFEEGVEKLLQRQRKTKKSLYDSLGMTRQGFDSKLKNNTVYVTDISKMASFFEMSELELFAELSNKSAIYLGEESKPDDYLVRLEDKLNSLLTQLAVKDRQIDGLQRTVDVLVGKSKGAIEIPLTAEDIFDLMTDLYALSVKMQGFDVDVPTVNSKSSGRIVGGTPFSHVENPVRIAN